MSDESEGGGGFGPLLGGLLLLVVLLIVVFAVTARLGLNPFMRHVHGRTPASEVKGNLKAAFTAERMYYVEKSALVSDATKIGFMPERGNRYAYFLAARGTVQRRESTELAFGRPLVIIDRDRLRYPDADPFRHFWQTGCPVTPCGNPPHVLTAPGVIAPNEAEPEGVFLFAGAGNLDRDEALDCWSICSHPREKDGVPNPPGEGLHEQVD